MLPTDPAIRMTGDGSSVILARCAMSRSFDLQSWLRDWPYDPEEDVRIARGDDGREVLQVRLPLGFEQYELDGRPDGHRPHGVESLLDHHLTRLERARRGGAEASFVLRAEECVELFNEATLYYYRYLRLFQLKHWERTMRDTSRNLRLFDFVHQFAEREEDQLYLEQWRPYLIRMHAMAGALLALDQDNHEEAMGIVTAAMVQIEALDDLGDEAYEFEQKRSLIALRELVDQIEEIRPLPEIERLRRELAKAIETQAFERAAELRDRIRRLDEAAQPADSG
jgi:hypothetical protein